METKDFTKFNIEQPAGFMLTYELHLGTSNGDSSKDRAMTLKADEDDQFKVGDEEATMLVRKFKKTSNKNQTFWKDLEHKIFKFQKGLWLSQVRFHGALCKIMYSMGY